MISRFLPHEFTDLYIFVNEGISVKDHGETVNDNSRLTPHTL